MWLNEGGGKTPKNVWWNDMVKEVLGARDVMAKDRWMEVYKEEKKKVYLSNH